MKIFVTGVAGFIGSHVATRLLARGDQIVGLDNFDETLYPAALHARNLGVVEKAGGVFHFERGDLCDAALVERIVGAGSFDAVLHLGALAGVRPSLVQPLRYSQVNVGGTLGLLEAMRRHGPRRLVFASSSSVYGARDEVPFRESDPAVHPASPYAATKRAGELLCETYATLYGLSVASLRFFTVYGPRQRPEMAIASFARHILEGTPLPFFGDGSTARDYTYIDDIVTGVVAAIDAPLPGHRVYNLGGSRTTTLAELVRRLEAILGRSAVLDRRPMQPGDVPITYADVSVAHKVLGYAPKISIDEGLGWYCDWLRSEG
jgi:UDP-glucuronate 4-epimerase